MLFRSGDEAHLLQAAGALQRGSEHPLAKAVLDACAAHLAQLKTPTLIVQGERDALGNRAAVEAYTLAPSIELMWLVERFNR